MRTFMWSWKKFIVGAAWDNIPVPPLTQRIQKREPWEMRSFLAIHLGFLTVVFEFTKDSRESKPGEYHIFQP